MSTNTISLGQGKEHPLDITFGFSFRGEVSWCGAGTHGRL